MEWSSLNRRDVRGLFPQRPALLVVDVQNYFVDPGGGAFLPGSREALRNITDLVAIFRERGLPIAFTRHGHDSQESAGVMNRWWGDLIMEGTWESRLVEEIDPGEGEPVFRKERYSAFQATGLAGHLERHQCDGVIVCGVMTHLCVETTAREAFGRDFLTVVVADACASDSEEHHLGALRNLAHGFALILGTDDVRGLLS